MPEATADSKAVEGILSMFGALSSCSGMTKSCQDTEDHILHLSQRCHRTPSAKRQATVLDLTSPSSSNGLRRLETKHRYLSHNTLYKATTGGRAPWARFGRPQTNGTIDDLHQT